MQSEFRDTWNLKLTNAHQTDPNSKLGTYLDVNPSLSPPTYSDDTFEIERINISRYRAGSHNLMIEIGRYANPRIERQHRICTCGINIQTIHHVFIECNIVKHSITNDSLRHGFSTISEFFEWNYLHEYLLHISKVLKIQI